MKHQAACELTLCLRRTRDFEWYLTRRAVQSKGSMRVSYGCKCQALLWGVGLAWVRTRSTLVDKSGGWG
jgi:hypothetical protein